MNLNYTNIQPAAPVIPTKPIHPGIAHIKPNTDTEKILNILNHAPDGFIKVCDICPRASSAYRWHYKNIDGPVMFSEHRSWIYAITIDDYICKIGETGNGLGYRTSKTRTHPQPSTKGRLSRYISHDGTDDVIRQSVHPYLDTSTVSIWVKKCSIITDTITVCGDTHTVINTTHKDQEKIYLDKIFRITGMYPCLNSGRA